MNIGIDLDEVLAKHMDKLIEFYYLEKGIKLSENDYHSYNWWETWGMNRQEAEKIDTEFKKSKFFDEIQIVDGAFDTLKALSQSHALSIITSRPLEVKEKTLKWISDNLKGINLRVIHSGDFWGNGKSKPDICKEKEIGLMIEDHGEYALKCANNGIKVLLVDKPWNRNVKHENIKRVGSWSEILGQINEKTDSHEEIIEKVKKFVEEECKKPTSHYGSEIFIYHFAPVHSYAKKLAEQLNADIEVVELAAWLHDIGSIMRGRKDHHVTGAEIAENKLREFGYHPEKIEKVKKCILNHRGSVATARESVEEQIIADADALSAFDNISGLFEASIFHEGFNQMQAKIEVRRKLINSWQKISPIARKMVEHKYLAAMILLGES